MKLNPLVLFGLAGALGLVAFLATQQHLSATTEERKVAVLVAKAEIDVGDPVTAQNAAMKEIPASALPPRPIVKPEQWQGLYAGSRFLPGEVMVQEKVAATFGSDSRSIPPGMLVQTINVDRAKSHAGLLTPGDRVDVFGSFDISEIDERTNRPRKYQMIKRILGDLEVWSVGSTVVGTEQGGDREGQKDTARKTTSTVGLLTTPEQYARLAGAEAAGKLFLGLRHPDDDSDAGDISFVTDDLYGDPRDQRRREEEEAERQAAETAAKSAATPAPAPAAGGLGAFLAAEQAGGAPAAPAALRADDVPTWTVVLHSGGSSRPAEVVDVAAARAAGFTPAQIAAKRRYLADPAAAPVGPNPLATRFAAGPGANETPFAPAEPPPTAAEPASGDPLADEPADDAPAAEPPRLSAAGVGADGMFPLPE